MDDTSPEQHGQRYHQDQTVWNQCAATYERQIVRGHPDVTAYESFEHSFLERMVLSLTRDSGTDLSVYDFGCGSGRIHLLLAPFLPLLSEDGREGTTEGGHGAGVVRHVGGVDFSEKMIDIALNNCKDAGMGHFHPRYLSYDVGSAFDVAPFSGDAVPLAVSVCNSIGVMQGAEGAAKLFETMGNYVRDCRGIAVISCYCRESVAGYALGNYESTMDVCGQPAWLSPDTFAKGGYTLVPRYYKRAHDKSAAIHVDVLDEKGSCVKKNMELTRDANAVAHTVKTGEIRTATDYQSNWYGTEQVRQWMREYWTGAQLWHVPGSALDRLRGEPAQLAIADFDGKFKPFAERLGLTPLAGEER